MSDIYDKNGCMDLLNHHEINDAEQGFMEGYLEL